MNPLQVVSGVVLDQIHYMASTTVPSASTLQPQHHVAHHPVADDAVAADVGGGAAQRGRAARARSSGRPGRAAPPPPAAPCSTTPAWTVAVRCRASIDSMVAHAFQRQDPARRGPSAPCTKQSGRPPPLMHGVRVAPAQAAGTSAVLRGRQRARLQPVEAATGPAVSATAAVSSSALVAHQGAGISMRGVHRGRHRNLRRAGGGDVAQARALMPAPLARCAASRQPAARGLDPQSPVRSCTIQCEPCTSRTIPQRSGTHPGRRTGRQRVRVRARPQITSVGTSTRNFAEGRA